MFDQHPLLLKISPFAGTISTSFTTNFLGSLFRRAFGFPSSLMWVDSLSCEYDYAFYAGKSKEPPPTLNVQTMYPRFKSEYFIYTTIAEALAKNCDTLNVIEWGSSYGRWLVNTAKAAEALNPSCKVYLCGIEASPIHFQSMQQTFIDNALPHTTYHPVHGALIPSNAINDLNGKAYIEPHMINEYHLTITSKPSNLATNVPILNLESLMRPKTWDILLIDLPKYTEEILYEQISLIDNHVNSILITTYSNNS
jgi:hypothetical protein